jgi:hypothetical protein
MHLGSTLVYVSSGCVRVGSVFTNEEGFTKTFLGLVKIGPFLGGFGSAGEGLDRVFHRSVAMSNLGWLTN